MTAAKKTTTATDTLKAVDEAVNVTKQTVESVVQAGTDAASKSYEQAVAASKEHVDAAVKAGETAFRNYEELVAFGKDTMDAMIKSSTIVLKGWQDMTRAVMGFAQASLDESIAHSKKVSGVKSVHELVELNQGFAKTGLDKAVAETSQISDMAMKLLEEAAAPLSDRVDVAVEKFIKPIAA